MIIVISTDHDGTPALTLDGPDDCSRFHVDARGVEPATAAAALAAAGAGTVQGDDAFIQPAVLERLAAGRVGPDWPERFTAMLAYAEKKGWTAADGTIQAHCEWSATD